MEVALRDVSKLAPLAVVLAIAGIAIGWMIQRQMGIGTCCSPRSCSATAWST